MESGSRVDLDEVVDLVLEAGRLSRFGGTEAERAAYSARKQDLVDRILAERRDERGGEPR